MINNTPSIFFVGPMKTATSLVYDYFSNHDQISVSQTINELFFYDNKYDKGYEWYSRQFPIDSTNKLLIDVSPSYFSSKLAMSRIHKDVTNPKVIITLRDPISRTLSHIRHLHRYGKKFDNLALMSESYPQILDSSMYSKYYNLWCDSIGKDNVVLMDGKKLKASQTDYFKSLCNHLSVDFQGEYDFSKHVNVASSPIFPGIAKISKFAADTARKHDINFLVELGKSLGLKRLLFTGGEPLEFSESDLDYLTSKLSNEIKWYNELNL